MKAIFISLPPSTTNINVTKIKYIKLINKSSLLIKPKAQNCITTNGINEKQNQNIKYTLKYD